MLGIIATVVAAGGALTVISKYNVPQVHGTYFNQNPFSVKADAIESASVWLFSAIAFVGVLVQVASLIFKFEERLHEWPTYLATFVVGTGLTIVGLWLTTALAYAVARPSWRPQLVAQMRDGHAHANQLLRNDGAEDAHLQLPAEELEGLRVRGREKLAAQIANLEELFDIADRSGSLSPRLERLAPVFAR
jgi:hypothetical protein